MLSLVGDEVTDISKFIKPNATILMLGVGGVSMSQLALAYRQLGLRVLGYDAHLSETVLNLKKQGIEVSNRWIKQMASACVCVRTGAIKDDNPILKNLKVNNIPIFDRAEALADCLKHFKCVIAVAGTHGKSTTCSLIYEMLKASNKKVSCHIGAEISSPRFVLGDDYIVVEACEYNKSFLKFYPNISVVTNVEPEHLDSYNGNFNELQHAFSLFLNRAENRFVFKENSTSFFKKLKNTNFVELQHFKTKLKGEYNQKNISLAVAVCSFLGVKKQVINKVLLSFAGVARRYEYIGNINKAKCYIDYAHHPTEVKAFVDAFILENPNALIVFQPHTYSRTKTFLNEFVSVFKNLKHICIFKEYPARENRSAGIDARELCKVVKQQNKNCFYASHIKHLERVVENYPAVAFVGAGDIAIKAKHMLT